MTTDRRSRLRSWLLWLAVAGGGYATILLVMVFLEESLIYFPSRYPDGFWDTSVLASGSGCEIEDCYFTTDDGVRLHGWWCRPRSTDATAGIVLLWFHGNAGNLSHRAAMMVRLARLPVQVLIVDYRGYGRSEGHPTEEGLYRDAAAAWRFLTEERAVEPGRVILFGKSLGGAVAVDLARRVQPAGLIVQSSFTSARDMAAHHFPLVPRALVRTRLDSLAKIAGVTCPKLFVHSPADEVVPFELGRKLFAAAAEPKRFYEVAGALHNETDLAGGEPYYQAVREFVASCGER